MYIEIRWPMISSSSLWLSRWFYAIFLFPFPFPTTSMLCVPLMPLPLNRARRSYVRGDLGRQLLPLLQLHPPPLPFFLRDVWLMMRSWRSFSVWMLALIHSLLSCIRWTPMLVVLPDGMLALVALWSLPLLLPRHPKMMMMMRMEMLALPVLVRCLLNTLTLCYSWQNGRVVLDMRVVILVGGGLV